MSEQDACPWEDEQDPLDPEISADQIAALLVRLGGERRQRVLDLGCGAGRVLVPLAGAGHEVVGIDRNQDVLDLCRARLAERTFTARLEVADFLGVWPGDLGEFDAVCCLGNTMMTVADVDDAVTLLEKVAQVLRPGGWFAMDDCPHEYWPELTDGRWQAGLTEDGNGQMVWAPGDAVFALRWGDKVDPDQWEPTEDDDRVRLWSLGALRLAARAAGLWGVERPTGEGLLIMRGRKSAADPTLPSLA